MARRKTQPSAPPPDPNLKILRADAEAQLMERIKLGKQLYVLNISSVQSFDDAKAQKTKWEDYNIELLKRIFDSPAISEEYKSIFIYGKMRVNPSLETLRESFKDGILKKTTGLESVVERLPLIPELTTEQPTTLTSSCDSKAVFIVHGHDDTAKVSTARFIEKLGLEAIILHEQPNKGLTIIEKFEKHAVNAGFAVVLFTPDDIGASKDDPNATRFRARQNVVLELGYFCGRLGRTKVCVLVSGDVELPSDYLGVVYISMDESSWQFDLAKEMKSSGVPFDLNKVFN